MRIQIAVPNDVARFPSSEERQLGTSKERYWKEEKSSEWTLERTREVHEKVAKDTVQDILRKSTDFLRRVVAAVGGMGGVTFLYVCPHCNSFPLEDCI